MPDGVIVRNPHSNRPVVPRQQRLSEMVAGTIGKRIVTGHYKPGDTLPTEPEVQAEFGVSRTAVREAIRLLSAKGLTASRPKIGTRVRPSGDWNMFDADVLRWQVEHGPSDEFVNALFEMREIIEPSAASLAAERATADDIAALGVAMDGIQNQPRGGPEQIAADIDFHMTILSASRNPILISVGAMINSALELSFTIGWRTVMAEDSVLQHRAVYEMIAARDAEGAFYGMRRLLRNSKGNVLDALQASRGHQEPF